MTSDDPLENDPFISKVDLSGLPPGFAEKTGPAAHKEKSKKPNTATTEEDDLAPTPMPEDHPQNNFSQTDPSVVQDYEQRISALEAELQQTKEQLMRAVADSDNTRKRANRERDDIRKYAISSFSKDLLEIADTFERALSFVEEGTIEENEHFKNFVEGVKATDRVLHRIFERNGIKKLEPLDTPFDPNFHEVMFEGAGSGKPAGTIIQVLENGYVLNGRLLRAAKVGVAARESEAPAPEQSAPSIDPGSQLDEEI